MINIIMITFLEYLSDSAEEYDIDLDSREAFKKILRSLRNETQLPISIINRGGKIVVLAPKYIHNRIELTWKNAC